MLRPIVAISVVVVMIGSGLTAIGLLLYQMGVF